MFKGYEQDGKNWALKECKTYAKHGQKQICPIKILFVLATPVCVFCISRKIFN